MNMLKLAFCLKCRIYYYVINGVPSHNCCSKEKVIKKYQMIIAEMYFDPEMGTLELLFEDGSKIEAVVTKKNGRMVSFIPNWYTDYHIRDNYPDLDLQKAQHVLEIVAQKYGDWLAEEASSNFSDAVGRVLEKLSGDRPACPWCNQKHPAREHHRCAPDAHLEAAYEERFEIE